MGGFSGGNRESNPLGEKSLLGVSGPQNIKWASLRENLSLGFPTKGDSSQSSQLQRLAIKLKFCL